MTQRKTARKFSEQRLGLHRRQLFHWIGSDLENDRNLSADQRTQKYINYLEHSLDRGLWLKIPRVKDSLGGNDEFQVTFPICCFTETTLDEIEFHNREYLSYAPARDLFTIVFPDNRTLAKALDNTKIRKLVHSPKLPPVTLLSLEDLGTF